MRRLLSLMRSIQIVTLVIAVPLAALFAYDRFVAAPGPFRGKSIIRWTYTLIRAFIW